jgi:predicted dehydrogenase
VTRHRSRPDSGRPHQTLSAAVSSPDECVVRVHSWLATAPVDEQFVVYEQSPRKVFDYLRKVGVRMTVLKVLSRLGERERNRKSYGVGVGWLVAPKPNMRPAAEELGTAVIFFAPNHSSRWAFIVLHRTFVRLLEQGVEHGPVERHPRIDLRPFASFAGHSPASGAAVDEVAIQAALAAASGGLGTDLTAVTSSTTGHRVREVPYRTATDDPVESDSSRNGARPTAVVFGLGNYTKTTILPYIQSSIDVRRIHEIDPDQLGSMRRRRGVQLTTSSEPIDDHRFDAWFVAGYHHTHTPLALTAMQAGSWAVIEKPIATTEEQLRELVATIESTDGKFIACFQKRYSRLHAWAMEDLAPKPDSPIDMHCTVFEIRLPSLHWYNWPLSGSRLLSNGCHWIDQFLFVNRYCPAVEERVWPARGSDIGVQLRLSNGACFSMILTDTGSPRLGVREHVELRAGSSTVTITDGSSYTAESAHRIVRRRTVRPLDAHRRMYRSIGERIRSAGHGDPLESLRSTELVLRLDAQAREHLPRRRG